MDNSKRQYRKNIEDQTKEFANYREITDKEKANHLETLNLQKIKTNELEAKLKDQKLNNDKLRNTIEEQVLLIEEGQSTLNKERLASSGQLSLMKLRIAELDKTNE